MSILQRCGLSLAAMAALTTLALSQTAAPARPAAPAQTKPAAPAPKPAPANLVLGTVNGEPIRSSEALPLLSQLSIRPGDEQRAYDTVMSIVVNNKLLGQYLKAQKIQVTPAEIDEVVAEYEKAAKEQNESLINQLALSHMTMNDLRDSITKTLEWKKYVQKIATEATLKKFADENKDAFNGTKVRASHILIQVPPEASDAVKQKAKERILAIKKEIESKKISFADAANKYSEDPSNKETPSGGDLDYFLRKDKFIESFSAAAFALKKGQISDPIETDYGYHLIQVTNRVEGQPIDFAKMRDEILYRYAQELQVRIVNDQRKKAEAAGTIKLQPMPPGLVQAEPRTARRSHQGRCQECRSRNQGSDAEVMPMKMEM